MNLFDGFEIVRGTSHTHATPDPDSTAHTGPACDMKGFESCLIGYLGSTKFTSNSTGATFQLLIGDTTAAMKAALASQFSLNTTAASSNTLDRSSLWVEVHKPTKRYIQGRVQLGFATSGNDNVQFLYLKYNPRKPGSTAMRASTAIGGSTLMVSPTTA